MVLTPTVIYGRISWTRWQTKPQLSPKSNQKDDYPYTAIRVRWTSPKQATIGKLQTKLFGDVKQTNRRKEIDSDIGHCDVYHETSLNPRILAIQKEALHK